MATEAEIKAEYEAKLEAKEAERVAAVEAQKAADERNENAQKVINEHRTKMGDDAKLKADSADKTLELAQKVLDATKDASEARESVERLQGEVAELKRQKPGPKEEEQPTREKVKERVAALESSLTEDDVKALDEAYKKLDAKDQAVVDKPKAERSKEEDARYLQFLQALRKHRKAPSVPSWRQTPAQKQDGSSGGDSANFDELFGKAKKSAEAYPDGHPSHGTGREGAKKVVRPSAERVKKKWSIEE